MPLSPLAVFDSDLVNPLDGGNGYGFVQNRQCSPHGLGCCILLLEPSEPSKNNLFADLEGGLFPRDLFAEFAYSLGHTDWSNGLLNPVRKVVGCLRLHP